MRTKTQTIRPEFVEDRHLHYLDGLNRTAGINIFAVRPLLKLEFGLTDEQARRVLLYYLNIRR